MSREAEPFSARWVNSSPPVPLDGSKSNGWLCHSLPSVAPLSFPDPLCVHRSPLPHLLLPCHLRLLFYSVGSHGPLPFRSQCCWVKRTGIAFRPQFSTPYTSLIKGENNKPEHPPVQWVTDMVVLLGEQVFHMEACATRLRVRKGLMVMGRGSSGPWQYLPVGHRGRLVQRSWGMEWCVWARRWHGWVGCSWWRCFLAATTGWCCQKLLLSFQQS